MQMLLVQAISSNLVSDLFEVKNLRGISAGIVARLRQLVLNLLVEPYKCLCWYRGTVVAKQKWTEEEEAALRAGVEK